MFDSVFEWRPIEGGSDVDNIAEIAASIHAELPERAAVLAEKIRLCPEACLKAVAGDQMLGYGLAHPWRLFEVPALDAFLVELPSSPDCFYVHDVAILPQARGRNMAGRYLDAIRAIASGRGIVHLACVSVYGTVGFWARHGFEEAADPRLKTKLKAYGETARYMIAPVA